ncbi:tetratricopeptide repeat protein [Aureispira anguillae]|uniref:Tetratricopeptide repeat protein n=1 Tax=Aureispira anguillae TaxID=2864201 RepID=A0A916DUG8_9BACT|nr:tetratricopeptide repeat protein [Aureispira anguillae]BDS12520.1 tetratricopeptide repeat protein [Aureispira anguillae]
MRVSVFILFLNSIIIAPVLAHNLYNITPQNNNENSPRNIPTITYTFNTSFAQQFVAHFDLNQPNSYPFQDLSDAAVYLTQLGETEKALDILQWLHQQHPQEYKIAANLGATHELKGDLDSAEHYIRKALDLSTDSTQKSAWVNLKIIAAKRSLNKNPNWLLENKVLNLNWDTSFYNNGLTLNDNNHQQDSLRLMRYKIYQNQFDTLWHIGTQMQKRIPYLQTPNLLVANIMKELADYFSITLSIKDAFIAYKIAIYYDPNDQLNTLAALNQLMPHFKKYEFDEAIFQQNFHPALASTELDKKYLPQYRGQPNINTNNQAMSPLFWQAGLAILILILIAGRIIWLDRKT